MHHLMIDAVLAAYGAEGAKLAATARAVELVEQALRQQGFRPVRCRRPWPGCVRVPPGT